MRIVNESDTNAQWFCYNSYDDIRAIALASGDLRPKESYEYRPPPNQTRKYTVEFQRTGSPLRGIDEAMVDFFWARLGGRVWRNRKIDRNPPQLQG
jgi:hypothetical protein